MYNGPAQAYVQAELQPPDSSNVDWEHKPSPFKQYQNCAQISLPIKSLQRHDDRSAPLMLEQVGDLLAKSYGLLQQHYTTQVFAAGIAMSNGLASLHLRRSVPSGGALFPCEIYLFSRAGEDLPAGIYHYDVAHHALDILQQHDVTTIVHSSLAYPGVACPAYIIALSCFFGKDGFKYGDFSYRLQGFDLGTVIAQCIAVLEQQTLSATVHYQFLDANVDELLGLDYHHESIYALITVDAVADTPKHSLATAIQVSSQQEMPSASALTSIAAWPLVAEVHQAALINTREQFCSPACLAEIIPPTATTSYTLPPIDQEPALLAGYQQRHSANGRFIPAPITTHQLAHFCYASSVGYESDLDGQTITLRHTLLYCVVNHVKDISRGIYCYNPHKHSLELVVAEDVQTELQALQWSQTVNFYDLSVCFFLVGDYNAGFHKYGDRWYRMQNMEAGMMVQRLYLTAAASQLGCRASLGFRQSGVRALLQLPEHQHALIEIMVAPEASPHGYYALPIHP